MTTCLLSGRLRWRIFSSLLRFLTVVWPQVWRRRKWLHQQTQTSSGRDSKAHNNLNIWNKIRRLLTDEADWPLTSLWSIYLLLVEELQVCWLWSGAFGDPERGQQGGVWWRLWGVFICRKVSQHLDEDVSALSVDQQLNHLCIHKGQTTAMFLLLSTINIYGIPPPRYWRDSAVSISG